MTTNTLCPACAAGLVRFDPQTGEERCGNCGAKVVPWESRELRAGETLCGLYPEPERKTFPPSCKTSDPSCKSPPLVLGGQGRDAEEVEADGIAWGFAVALGLGLLVAVFALGVGIVTIAAWVAR